jgi:ACS family pantothenate transporter-like MFS transporter
VILYVMSMVQSILYTFWGIALYPATDAPYWQKGYVTLIVVVFAFFACTVAVQWVSWGFRVVGVALTEYTVG